MVVTFLRGTKAPLKGELAAARLTERWMQICCKYSKATTHKTDSYISGGAYQDAREVTIVWNDA